MLDIDDSNFDDDDGPDELALPYDPGDAVDQRWVDADLAGWPSRPVADDLDVARRLFAHLAGRIGRCVGRIGIVGAIAPVG